MKTFVSFGIMTFLMGMLMGCLVSCTYSITMVHTEGQATDVVDETQRADPDVQTDLSIPAL
jgi:hypothetical protein